MRSSLGLAQRVMEYIQRQALLSQGETILVGVSGGPDSVCLLHLLASLQAGLGIRLHVAHLNHGLRGVDSEADALYVSALAQGLGLPSTIGYRDVATYRSQGHLSLEEASRKVRYDFFSQVAESVGASRVAIGHTTEDQVETILLHMVRGAGLRGLRGMAPLSQWRSQKRLPIWVVRPLLEVSREETVAYCREQGLIPRLDVSNYSPAFLRNRLRLLLPQLESLNPAVGSAFLRLGKAATEAVDFIEAEVSKAWPQVVGREDVLRVALDKSRLSQLPAAIQRHLLMVAWERLKGDPQDLEAIHIEDMLAALTHPVGTRLDLPGGMIFWVDYDYVSIGLRDTGESNCPFPLLTGEFPLQIPGETSFPGWRVRASILPREDVRQLRSQSLRQCSESSSGQKKTLTACMDFQIAGQQLWVRPRRPGDRFQPLGLSGDKKLQDFMVDAKIPRAWRDRVPLVCSPQGILWVVGYRLADGVRVSENTERVLRLEFKKADFLSG